MSVQNLHAKRFQPRCSRAQVYSSGLILFVVLFSMLTSSPLRAQTYNGNLVLTTQAQVNAFSYTEVTGYLQVSGPDISNLQPLSLLKKTGGTLSIKNNPSLTAITDLNNLTSTGGAVDIVANPALITVAGFDNLTSIGEYLAFNTNPSLTSVAGFGNLTSVGLFLAIVSNPKLSACCIPPSLPAHVKGGVFIDGNAPGCNSAAELNTACAPAATLSVSYADGSGQQTSGNVVRPYLQLNNEGNSPVALKNITVRYWLTVEEFDSLNTSISWAKLGTSLVSVRYVPLGQPRLGAYGYIEYAFPVGAGSLAAMTNSGPILSQIRKADWTAFNQADDYSYASSTSYAKNNKITAYYNGVLVWGAEPPISQALIQSLMVSSANRDAITTSSIGLNFQLWNRGNQPVSYRDLTFRYWFTAEGNQSLLYQLDYAKMGELGITAKFVKLPTPLPTADTYLEVGFTSADSLYPLSSTGDLLMRIRKSDWSGLNQLNDHSYLDRTGVTLNSNITVYLKEGTGYFLTGRVYGTEPTAASILASSTAPGAMATEQQGEGLRVMLLGNPVRSDAVEMMISGAQGEQVKVVVTDAFGRTVSERQVGRAGVQERVSVPVDGAASQLLFIRVSTGKQTKTVSVVKAK
ncbi:MAG: hypothetical protein INR73_10670 [Williamsia sp.]|nr:hypothetical protein [Williamsia sp.]